MADEKNGTSIEALNRDLIALKNQLKTASKSDETYRSEKLKAIIEKAKKSAESDEAEYVFGAFFKTIVEFEAEIGRLKSDLERAISEKNLAEQNAERWREKARSMRLERREKEAEILSLRNGIERADVAERERVVTWREAVGGALAAVCGGWRENLERG